MRRALAVGVAACTLARSASADEAPKEETDRGDDDVVEVLDDAPQPGQAPAKVGPLPGAPDKFEVRGFARTTFAYGLPAEGSAPRLSGAPPAQTPTEERVGYERAVSVNQAYLDVRYTRAKSFQAVLSGSLAYSAALVEGVPGQDFKQQELQSVLVEPVLREAYLGFYSERVDVRLGQQRIVWGNSDAAAPNDILNARDQRNRLQLDPEMVNIPTLAARADFDLGIAVLGVVAQPFFVPDRTSIYGNNWSIVQPDAPRHVRKFFGTHGQGRDPAEIEAAFIRTKSTQASLDGASVGASLRFHFGSFDASYYYQYGRDRSPFIYLDPAVAAELDRSGGTGQSLQEIYAIQARASEAYGGPFIVQSIRRHHVGTDLATTAGPFVLRADAAFDTAMTFYAKDTLNSVARPSAQLVVGAEYQSGFGKVIVLEGTYMRLLGPEIPIVPVTNQANDGPLLFVKEDNLGVANAIRWLFWEKLVVETRTFLGVQPLSWLVRPEIGYATSNFTVRAGYLAIDGSGGSFGGYYRRNESLYLTTRYSF